MSEISMQELETQFGELLPEREALGCFGRHLNPCHPQPVHCHPEPCHPEPCHPEPCHPQPEPCRDDDSWGGFWRDHRDWDY